MLTRAGKKSQRGRFIVRLQVTLHEGKEYVRSLNKNYRTDAPSDLEETMEVAAEAIERRIGEENG